ncbi:MAG: DUF454 domain-containing protein [Planctomycetes bacterium]|nr:DUF454 domain-containing protein [Planctomycetota bacterium]
MLGIIGIALPGLPTTPFLLLTSFFLARSWPRMHQRLLASKLFGPVLRPWKQLSVSRSRGQRHCARKRPTVRRVGFGCWHYQDTSGQAFMGCVCSSFHAENFSLMPVAFAIGAVCSADVGSDASDVAVGANHLRRWISENGICHRSAARL